MTQEWHFGCSPLRTVTGLTKNTHHSFNRSDAITTWSFAFSRATGYLVVLYFELSLVPCKVDLGSDWLDLWLCVFISIIDQIAQYRYKHNFLSTRQYTKFIPFLVIFNSALSSSFMQLNLCSKGKLWRKKTKKTKTLNLTQSLTTQSF